MSSNSDQEAALSKINFPGGFPISTDLAPSVVFLVAVSRSVWRSPPYYEIQFKQFSSGVLSSVKYTLIIPLLILRLSRKSDRGWILLQPVLFVICRIEMLAIRSYMSKNSYSSGLLIAEVIFVSLGVLLLIKTAITLWKRHMDSSTSNDQHPGWVLQLSRMLQSLVLAAIGTAVAGAALISSALTDSSKLDTVKTLRQASSILCLAPTVVLLFATVHMHFVFPVNLRGTAFIFLITACLTIVATYRVIQTYSDGDSNSTGARTAFWIFQMLFEFIAFTLLCAISIPTWFPVKATASALPLMDVEMRET